MLEIDVVIEESFDESTDKFAALNSFKVQLEHSLATMSKWESIWEEPFLGKKDKTQKQTISYVEMMILNDDLPPGVFQELLKSHLAEVQTYVAAKMTATTIRTDPNAPQSREVVTSELIYYWMVSMNIPVEFEHWHLNRLMTLIQVINLKNDPKKKRMSSQERRSLNRSRLAQNKTTG
jgi:hypothetical protein